MRLSARQIADRYLAARSAFDPEAAQAVGNDPHIVLPALAPSDFDRRAALDRETLAELEHAHDEAEDHALAMVMRERLGSDVALDEVGFTRRLLAPLATPPHLIRQTFDGLPLETTADAERVLANLRVVPDALRNYQDTLLEQAAVGNIVAQRQLKVVASQCDSWVREHFYPVLVSSSSILRISGMDAAAADAERATGEFAEFLRGRLLPAAGARDAVGRDTYEVTSAAFLGQRVDLDELYAWGWDLIAELQEDARRTAEEIVGERDVAAAIAALDANTAGRVETGEDLRAWLQLRLDQVTEAVDGVWFDIPDAVKTVEARISTADSGVMYYTPPDAGLTRPGRVWWTVPTGARYVSTWREVSTVHHEGVPGHHLQHAVTHGLQHLHPWQRYLCQVHGYAEGWAHHAEQLAVDLGLVPDPGERLGVIFARLWRACRVVIDIGLHLEKSIPGNAGLQVTKWSPDVAVTMLQQVAEVDPQTARFEVDRYLGWPGQALAFSVGALLWRDAMTRARDAEGCEFDLREFHNAAMGLGPMGLGPLASQLEVMFPGKKGSRR